MPEMQSPSESQKEPMQQGQGPQGTELNAAQLAARAAGSRSGGPFSPKLLNPITVGDIEMTVDSSTGINIGMKVLIDTEVMRVAQALLATRYAGGNVIPILRGQSGTATRPHAVGSVMVIGDAMLDFAINSAPGLVADFPGATPMAPSVSMAADQLAVPVPTSVGFTSVILPSAGNLTLALPGQDLNGALLTLVGNAAGAGTVQIASTPTPTTPGGAAGSSVTVSPGEAKLLRAQGGNWIEFPTP